MLGWGWLGGVGWGNNVLYLHTLLLLRQRLFSCYVIRTSLFFTCAFFYATLYFWCYFVRILLHFHIFNIMSLELMLRQDNVMLWKLRVRRSWLVLLLQSDATLLCKLLDATSQELLRSWHYARRPWLVLLLPRDHILPKKTARKTWKKCTKCWKGCRNPFSEQTLSEVLHAFLADRFQTKSFKTTIFNDSQKPWIRNIHKRRAPFLGAGTWFLGRFSSKNPPWQSTVVNQPAWLLGPRQMICFQWLNQVILHINALITGVTS